MMAAWSYRACLDSSICGIQPFTLYRNSLYGRRRPDPHCFNKQRVIWSVKAAPCIQWTRTLYGAVCILRVRDCPFPPRINNKIIITKSTERLKGWFLHYSLFVRRKNEGDMSSRGKVLYGKILKKNKGEKLRRLLVLIIKTFRKSRIISKWDETLAIWASCHNIWVTIIV